MSLAGKRIIVTGASSGIGEETARLLMHKRAEVTGLDIKAPSQEMDHFVYYDQSSDNSIRQAAEQLNGQYDAICNVAGVAPVIGAAKVLAINFLGARQLTELLIPGISKGGCIVNVSSVAGFFWQHNLQNVEKLLALTEMNQVHKFCDEHEIIEQGMEPNSSYPLGKQAWIVWSLRQVEVLQERNIRINVLSPGPVQTPILKDFESSIGELPPDPFLSQLRAGQAVEIARVATFLCSDEAAWINGVNLPVDGGLSAYLQMHPPV